jgi:hypothetical protein
MKYAYWSREIAGWVLILIGLYTFMRAYDLLLSKRIFEATPVVFIGFIVFRGGTHILKVAVAAQAARNLPESLQPRARRVARATARPIGPTPSSAVMPGRRPPRPADARG